MSEKELSNRDKRRLRKIKWRRGKNDLYFGKFETKKEAYLKLKELANRYKSTPVHKNTIKDLCEEYQEKGIYFYPTQVGKWLKQVFNITIKYPGYGKPKQKKVVTWSIDKELDDVLSTIAKNMHKRSWWMNTCLRILAGLPCEELLVFFEGVESGRYYEQEGYYDPEQVGCLFYKDKEEWRALYMGKVHSSTRKLIQSLCSEAENYDSYPDTKTGRKHLITKCEALGFFAVNKKGE